MPSIRLEVIQNTARLIEIDLVDGNGRRFPMHELVGAVAEFFVKVNATDDANVLYFITPTVGSFTFKTGRPALILNLAPIDTRTLTIATYTFMVKLTLVSGEIYDVIEWSPFDLTLGGETAPAPPVFDNTVLVNQDYDLPDNLTYLTPGGSPICEAQVRIYLKSDYDAGRLTTPVGITLTDKKGHWQTALRVTPGYQYVVQFMKPNEWGPDSAIISA